MLQVFRQFIAFWDYVLPQGQWGFTLVLIRDLNLVPNYWRVLSYEYKVELRINLFHGWACWTTACSTTADTMNRSVWQAPQSSNSTRTQTLVSLVLQIRSEGQSKFMYPPMGQHVTALTVRVMYRAHVSAVIHDVAWTRTIYVPHHAAQDTTTD